MIIRVWMNPTRQTSKLRSRYICRGRTLFRNKNLCWPKILQRERKLVVHSTQQKFATVLYIDFIFNPCNFIFTLKNALFFVSRIHTILSSPNPKLWEEWKRRRIEVWKNWCGFWLVQIFECQWCSSWRRNGLWKFNVMIHGSVQLHDISCVLTLNWKKLGR